jgi:hypothetical protein
VDTTSKTAAAAQHRLHRPGRRSAHWVCRAAQRWLSTTTKALESPKITDSILPCIIRWAQGRRYGTTLPTPGRRGRPSSTTLFLWIPAHGGTPRRNAKPSGHGPPPRPQHNQHPQRRRAQQPTPQRGNGCDAGATGGPQTATSNSRDNAHQSARPDGGRLRRRTGHRDSRPRA